ncbi:MAG: ACP S-malonyltransferase [Alphaproteobacteria bacterium]|jgi:[acyl-carrier-protein] S-malonyltransferase|nr:ACP S-malonyltransferase [Alphaproteobacteria bacterium]
MTLSFTFPGQGSQVVGMGREFVETFPAARQVFEEVDEALQQKFSKLILEGPQDTLTLTENAQPAIMAVSMAIVRTLEAELGKPLSSLCTYLAGHSLGEYTALCATGVFSIPDTARLLRLRGQAMQEAVPIGVGAMAAILGLDALEVEALANDAALGEVCVIANDNSPGQIVLSGHKGAIDRAITLANERGAKRAIPLEVSAPFHCSLMEPAARAMAPALKETQMNEAQKPVMSNVTAMPIKETSLIRSLLIDQITGRVRWREIGLNLGSLGVTNVIEIGAGKVLTGLIKRIDPGLEASSINTPADMDAFLKTL